MPPSVDLRAGSHQNSNIRWHKNIVHHSVESKHPGFDPAELSLEYLKGIKQLSNCSLETIMSLYSTSFKGLTSAEAKCRLKLYGLNQIQLPKVKSHQQTKSGLSSTRDSGSFSNPRTKSTVLKSSPEKTFLEYIPTMALVLRNKIEEPDSTCELVPGDIVTLKPGMWVPADLYLIQHDDDLTVCEHLFGGIKRTFQTDMAPIKIKGLRFLITDVKGICWMGSEVLNGEGRGVVIETGNHTALGRMMHSQ